MRQYYHSIVKWSLLTGTSTIILKLCYESMFRTNTMISTRSMSIYGSHLKSWALTGETSRITSRKFQQTRHRDDLQLIGAQIYFRHGARTPLSLLPGLEEVVYTKEHVESLPTTKWDVKLITKLGNQIVAKEKISSANDIIGNRSRQLKSITGQRIVTGQLTSIGEQQLYQLGKTIRSHLIKDNDQGLIPSIYDPKNVYARSTYMDRTIASARSFLSGLYSSDKNNGKIQAKGPFEIEVHNFPDEDMFPNPNVYPILKKCLTAIDLYAALEDNHPLKKSRETLLARLGIKDYKFGIVELHDDIVSRQAHNFSVPDDYLELTKHFPSFSAREFVSMGTSIGFDQFIRATCGSLLYLMRENFKSIHENYLENKEKTYQNCFIYSGHDTTLIPLAMALEIFDMIWPNYGAYILAKYYISKKNPKESFITVDYAGEPQILPNCDNYYCPYSTLMKNLENRFEKPKFLVDS